MQRTKKTPYDMYFDHVYSFFQKIARDHPYTRPKKDELMLKFRIFMCPTALNPYIFLNMQRTKTTPLLMYFNDVYFRWVGQKSLRLTPRPPLKGALMLTMCR